MHNKELADCQNLGEEERNVIDILHRMREQIVARPSMFVEEENLAEVLHGIEFCLQWLWQFPLDKRYHKGVEEYLFKRPWVGRTFRCKVTEEEFTIPDAVKECDFFRIGDGYVDVGRLNFYSRSAGVEEVVKE